MIASNRMSLFVLVLASTIGMYLVACDSNLGTPTGAQDAGTSNGCEDAGYRCAFIKPGCGTNVSAPYDCDTTAFVCCTSYDSFTCGVHVCTDGNTCDTNHPGYCSNAFNPPNCGTFTCLGACTCAGASCVCPTCQRTSETCTVGGQSVGVYYKCDPALTPDAGSADFPADAGACVEDATGNLCCAF